MNKTSLSSLFHWHTRCSQFEVISLFRILEFQTKVINRLDTYLDRLKLQKKNADDVRKVAQVNTSIDIPIPNFVETTIEHLRNDGTLPQSHAQIPYDCLDRRDGCERPVPNVVYKVPTAGGKTYLAVRSIERILSSYLEKNTGFVLWVVPNEAIYSQTLKTLNDRNHPYRQTLDNAAAGRVKILEKHSSLSAMDVEANLCIMIVMLQSTNRQNQDTLKMFRERGDVHGFIPSEGEMGAHATLYEQIPNLAIYDHNYSLIKESLGNALRIIRPIVVIDEGHKTTSELAHSTIYGFNPCFVLELTATPKIVPAKNGRTARYPNTLVTITGKEVDAEGMIKMPINLNPMQGTDWVNTLSVSLERLNILQGHAEQFYADSGRYIRPIMLVQVERTGADQRDADFIHSEDVREQLLQMGLGEAEIAVKTAEINDLRNPENQNLLIPENRIRVIITKQALQEGWDCPFAYVLCSLAASSNMSAMTQLVGRILRQPQALKTEVSELDECYITTHHANTAEVVGKIRESLEKEGLGDLVLQIAGGENLVGNGNPVREISRRDQFTEAEIYLPQVLFNENDTFRMLDYETDILSQIDWSDFDVTEIVATFPDNAQANENQLQRIGLNDDGVITNIVSAENTQTMRFDMVYASRVINGYVPNSFVAYEIVQNVIRGLLARGLPDTYIGQQTNLIIEILRLELNRERDVRAEQIFRASLGDGTIQFRLRADGNNWQMPDTEYTTLPENAMPLMNARFQHVSKSLFDPIYQDDLNAAEQDVAVYLDSEETIQWWHRNVARRQYGIQGWRRNKIYPDFLFVVNGKEGKINCLKILETKGDQLDNLDTAYKRCVMETLASHYSFQELTDAGECVIEDEGLSVDARLILFPTMTTELPNWISEKE